jgi:hypothetical protein
VTAAREALAGADVEVILPYVHSEGEAEVHYAFDLAKKAVRLGLTPEKWPIAGASRPLCACIAPGKAPPSRG